jgi:sec-independent protein translocase protein TatB
MARPPPEDTAGASAVAGNGVDEPANACCPDTSTVTMPAALTVASSARRTPNIVLPPPRQPPAGGASADVAGWTGSVEVRTRNEREIRPSCRCDLIRTDGIGIEQDGKSPAGVTDACVAYPVPVFDISGWEFLTLAALAVIIFGPERLPKLAADAGRFVRQMRGFVHNAKSELTADLDLGPELQDLKKMDLRASDLTPRGLLRKTLGDDDPFADLRNDLQFDELRTPLTYETAASTRLQAGEIPPFDLDST